MKRIIGLLLFLQTVLLGKALSESCERKLVNICDCRTTNCPRSKCPNAWEYGTKSEIGFDSWPEMCKLGKRQSPIDVRMSTTQPCCNSYEIIFRDYNNPIHCGQVFLHNNGRTAKFSIKSSAPGFTLNDKYRGRTHNYAFDHGHFHWASHDRKGSEHHINGKVFPLELHLVHFNTAVAQTLEKSIKVNKPNSLSVLGIMFQLSDQPNKKLNPFFDALKQIQNEGDKVNVLNEMGQFSLSNFLPKNTKNFVQYFGSLTTPDCNEVVHWIIFRDAVYISREQMQLFRNLTFQSRNGKRNIVDNYRPIQQLNGRSIF